MNSKPDEPLGTQEPRVSSTPPAEWSLGDDAIDLAKAAGLHLDPWQQLVLRRSMGERAPDEWAAREVALIVPRQNGKTALIEARELHALFLEPKTRLILHSCHEFKSSSEAFLRIKGLIDGCPALRKRVAPRGIRTSHGEEGIELIDGSRLRFVARSTGSGRGFSGDLIVLDEAYALTSAGMAALLPTLSARPNPQIVYASSAGLPNSHQLRLIRDRGRSSDPGPLAYFEWSAPENALLDDRAAWRQANPAMGIRITEEFVDTERRALPDSEFARERLGIWPDDGSAAVIDAKLWDSLADPHTRPAGNVVFAVDVSPDRRTSSIASCGRREDERFHIKIVDHREGTGWVVDRIVDLDDRYRPPAIIIDPAGPAGSFIAELTDKGVEPILVTAREMAQACGGFIDDCTNDRIRHPGQGALTAAVRAATTRNLGDAFAWDRRDSGGNISPLVAVTLALDGFRKHSTAAVEPWVAFQ